MDKTQLETVVKELGFPSLASIEEVDGMYVLFKRRKKSGGFREISVPNVELAWAQRLIWKYLKKEIGEFPAHLQGGVSDRSPLTNARLHAKAKIVLNLDLKDYFDSITPKMVAEALVSHKIDQEMSELIARICTRDGRLPQGAATSVLLANIVGLKLDFQLLELTKGLVYSRYIDDLTISGDFNVDSLLPELAATIEKHGFAINESKKRIQRSYRRQIVTGVVVNQECRVPKEFLKAIKKDLYFCERFGVFGHCATKGLDLRRFVRSLAARIGYVNSIQPKVGVQLGSRFRRLKDEIEGEKCYEERKRLIALANSNVR